MIDTIYLGIGIFVVWVLMKLIAHVITDNDD